MLCTPTISKVAVTRTLIYDGAGLNILFVEAFNQLHVPYDQLAPSKPFSGLINFDVARIGLSYNAILGDPVLAKFMAATHPGYNVVKMTGSSGILTVVGDTKGALLAVKLTFRATAAVRPDAEGAPKISETMPVKKKQWFSQDQAKTKQVPVDDGGSGPTFTIRAGGLPPDQEEALVGFLRANRDVFSWEATDLVVVPRDVIEHRLMVCPGARPVKQKARWQAPEKQSFIVQEVHKLQKAGVIREVRHPDWLANPVIVPKQGGKEHMCVDFTSLKKLGRNAEANIDNIVVKSWEARALVGDLEETFANLRKVNLHLNPEKCVFGVPSGKLQGFLVSHRGIEANPDKIKAIERMSPPQTIKDM
ncbi:uncharacterized protein [Aegilops tauschii subsp. strangulata]|uniref:uncharacterized protein n=1 Tax=Aegilops tauschii subsp. strangulata TaxID=200361 RepID=UPI003CC8B1B1